MLGASPGYPGVLCRDHVRPEDQAVQLQLGPFGQLRKPEGTQPVQQLAVRELARAAKVGDHVRELVAGVAAVASNVPQLRVFFLRGECMDSISEQSSERATHEIGSRPDR